MSADHTHAATIEELRLICANVCKPEIHEAMKRDHRWSMLPLVARHHTEADEYGPAETLEYRNCGCKSTIAKALDEA